MKSVVAIIREEKFQDVKDALLEVGCEGMNVSEVKGRGSQRGIRESYRGSSYCIDLIPKTRIEIVVKDEGVDLIVDAIKKGAFTGNIGDGKIFIYPMDNVIRIRTGEEGDSAIWYALIIPFKMLFKNSGLKKHYLKPYGINIPFFS